MKSRLEQITSQNVKQIQRLILSPQMQQALHLLQLPLLELSTVIEEEMTQNPLLECDDFREENLDFLRQVEENPSYSKRAERGDEEDLQAFIENTLSEEHSLFEHLLQQAKETFEQEEELELATLLIGNLDSNGILATSLEEIALLSNVSSQALLKILKIIQTFDPLGVGAQNLQEVLLIQLRALGKEESLAFRILETHYDDLIHNRIPLIAKSLECPTAEIHRAITHEISHLDLHPGFNLPSGHYREVVQTIIPDVVIHVRDGEFSILINDEKIPQIRFNHHYLKMLEDPSLSSETRDYIKEKIASGKWLLRNLSERNQTLYRITEELIKEQNSFFSHPEGKLNPITMKEIAQKLELHESTIARAVSNKYVSSPRGVLPLRSFFTHAYHTEAGESISAQTVKDLLKEIVSQENRAAPLSDEAISQMIKDKGIPCARRTVAKYRQELNIGNTIQRRMY